MVPADKVFIPFFLEGPQDRKTTRTAFILGTAASTFLHLVIFGFLFVTAQLPLNPHPVQTLPVIQVNLMPVGGIRPSLVRPLPNTTDRDPVPTHITQTTRSAEKVTTDRSDQGGRIPEANQSVTLPQPVALSDPGPQPEAEAITDKHTELGVTTTRTTSDALRKTDDAVSQMPRYLHTPFPLYPFEARKKGQEGLVLLTVVILDNGRVGQVQIKKTSGYANLDQSAMMAVQNWRFEPLRKDNSLRSTIVNIPIRFSLKER